MARHGETDLPCTGRQECLCDLCVDRKLQLLKHAPPDVQRSFLLHLPPDDLSPTITTSSSAAHSGTAASSSSDTTTPSASRQPLHTLSLFKLPLWPTHVDAIFDDTTAPTRDPPSLFDDIVIPPLVREHIPTIEACIAYVKANAQITGPRKEAALVEAVDEILAICEKKLREDPNV